MQSTNPAQTPLISVVAVSYNHAHFVLETLESIAAQTWKNIEIIYCDDVSTDNTVEIATRWLQATNLPWQTIIHKENRGLCNTLNEARKLCRGEFFQYISCDDRLHPHKFEQQIQVFQNSPESVGVVCSEASLIDDQGKPFRPYQFTKRYAVPDNRSRKNLYEQLLRGEPCIAAPTALIKRSVLEEMGPYDPELPYEDYDMWLRILKKYDFSIIDSPTADFRIHQHNLHTQLKNQDRFFAIRNHVLKKHFDSEYGREMYRKNVLLMISENKLLPISAEDLIASEFSLQEVADMVHRMKYSKSYILCTYLKDFYFYLKHWLRLGR